MRKRGEEGCNTPYTRVENNGNVQSGNMWIAGTVPAGRRSMYGKFVNAQGNQCGCRRNCGKKWLWEANGLKEANGLREGLQTEDIYNIRLIRVNVWPVHLIMLFLLAIFAVMRD